MLLNTYTKSKINVALRTYDNHKHYNFILLHMVNINVLTHLKFDGRDATLFCFTKQDGMGTNYLL